MKDAQEAVATTRTDMVYMQADDQRQFSQQREVMDA